MLATGGNSLSTEHRAKLLQALRGGLELSIEATGAELPTQGNAGPSEPSPDATNAAQVLEQPEVLQESEVLKQPEAPSPPPAEAPNIQAILPNVADPVREMERHKELLAKDRQIEVLEVKVRRLASLLRERERRNAEAQEEAARVQSRFPGVSRLRRKAQSVPKEGSSELMLGIRELNRQIREEIQSLYSADVANPEAGSGQGNGGTRVE